MASHVIVNLLRPLAERISFHCKIEPPAEIELFYCRLLHSEIFYFTLKYFFQHGTITSTKCMSIELSITQEFWKIGQNLAKL